MSINIRHVKALINNFKKRASLEDLAKYVSRLILPYDDNASVPVNEPFTLEGQQQRLDHIEAQTGMKMPLVSSANNVLENLSDLKGNIENYIGMAQIPIGIAGPLNIKGVYARGSYFIPFATTEGALVASYNRGMKACGLAGGISTVFLSEGVQRSPFFKFKDIGDAGIFLGWISEQKSKFKELTKATSNYARLKEVNINVEGNSLIVTLNFITGDAAGQNMVTIAAQHICNYILKNTPVEPIEWYVESNFSGDKKATFLSFSNVRGKKVTSEIVLKKDIVENVLKSTPNKMAKYWQSSSLAVVQSGAIGMQGHVANGLTALFIATGQDVACIAEASVGVTRMEVNSEGNLYVSVTLPTLIVGTVGGGTGLPTQKECLELLDCYGAGNARKLAEICTAVALVGEISIAAALSADHFTQAHKSLGRE